MKVSKDLSEHALEKKRHTSFINPIHGIYQFSCLLCLLSVPIVLVGNKTDLHMERVVTTDQGRKIAEMWKAVFLETSAKQHEVRITCICNRLGMAWILASQHLGLEM